MAEIPGRFIGNEAWRAPAANSYKVLYTLPDTVRTALAVHVCNGKGADAHISLYIIPVTDTSGWAEGEIKPPDYTAVCENIRIEADGTDGNIWGSPALYLNPEDRLVGMTTLVGVTFYPHGVSTTG